MGEQVQRALADDRTVDITTVGRRSGQPRRIGREGALDDWVDRSPLIEVELLGQENSA